LLRFVGCQHAGLPLLFLRRGRQCRRHARLGDYGSARPTVGNVCASPLCTAPIATNAVMVSFSAKDSLICLPTSHIDSNELAKIASPNR
jgi:hypothetical protein